MKLIIEALLKAQTEMGNAVKNGVNPHFKSKFADLNSVREAVMPLLNANKIIVLQPMITIDGSEYVKTVLLHESGETIESFTKILCKSQNDPQAYGSGVTYARRYGLQSLLSIGADDDDGNQASEAPTQKSNDLETKTVAIAVTEAMACKTINALGEVWKKWDVLKTNSEFIKVVTNKKIELNGTNESK